MIDTCYLFAPEWILSSESFALKDYFILQKNELVKD